MQSTVGLTHVLVLAVHMVNLLGFVGQEDHSKAFLPSLLEHSFIFKSCEWIGGVVSDANIVLAPVQRIGILDFSDLVLTEGPTFGPVRRGDWVLGLTINWGACW